MNAAAQQAAVALKTEMDAKAKPVRLYEIVTELEAIEDALVDNGGELTPELEAALDAWTVALDTKVERICQGIANHARTADAFAAEIERLQSHQKAHANAAKSMKDWLLSQLKRLGRDKVTTKLFKVSIQKNSRPTIRWPLPLETLPAEYKRVVVELDGTAAYEAERAGILPVGFSVEYGQHLRVR